MCSTGTSRNKFISNFLPISRPSTSQTKQAHARLIITGHGNNAQLISHLISALSLSPSTPFHYPLSIFNTIPNPTLFAANNLIRCFAKSPSPTHSLLFYGSVLLRLFKPNNFTYPFVFQGCANMCGFNEGSQVHAHVIQLGFDHDSFGVNSLIHFYSACYRIESSKRVFDESVLCRDIVTWNAILAGYLRDGQIDAAEKLFDEMPDRDDISWSSMITGYVQNGKFEQGLDCFKEMWEKGLKPNEAAFVMVLSASAQLGLLEHGRLVHSIFDSLRIPVTVALGTALIDMYAKCGCVKQSWVLFNSMHKKDIRTWNVMICGLAAHGFGKEALLLFERFIESGLRPSIVTFIAVLNACSRAGLVDEGRNYYKLMTETYKMVPEIEHYGCMVDLFARAGFIDEAVELVENMAIPPDPVLWATLLCACKIYGLVELGQSIGNKLIHLDPTYDGHYVQLSSIYAKSKKWEDVVRVRRLMSDRKINKLAGWSLIESQSKIHRFVAGDREHERSSEIYSMMETIERRIAEVDYMPDISSVLHDMT